VLPCPAGKVIFEKPLGSASRSNNYTEITCFFIFSLPGKTKKQKSFSLSLKVHAQSPLSGYSEKIF
jgi:hypothetical protein